MKWIKYQVVCDPTGGNELCITKKVEYSEENLKIAEEEAYHGYVKIEEDDEENRKEPLPLEFGGTNAMTRPDASQNINFIGVNPIKRAEEDTVDNWAKLGTGFAFYDTHAINDFSLPTKGFIENRCYTNPDTGEIFVSQVLRPVGFASDFVFGSSYHRFGSSRDLNSWYKNGYSQNDDGWAEIIDENSSKLPTIQHGYIDDVKISGNTIEELTVKFPNKFFRTPRVLLQIYSSSTSTDIGKITVALSSAPSLTGFKIKVFNAANTQRAPSIYWVAIGK